MEFNAEPHMSTAGVGYVPFDYVHNLKRQVVEDIAKVVVDWEEDKSAETGRFE